jgi:hypothetical protein
MMSNDDPNAVLALPHDHHDHHDHHDADPDPDAAAYPPIEIAGPSVESYPHAHDLAHAPAELHQHQPTTTEDEQAAAAAIAAAAASWCVEEDVNRLLQTKDAEIATLKQTVDATQTEIQRLQALLDKKPAGKKKFHPSQPKTAIDLTIQDIADESIKISGKSDRKTSAADARWKARFQQVVAYKLQHGHCNVPKSHTDKSLHAWVRNQRDAKKQLEAGKRRLGRDTMTQERMDALNSIGFQWVVGHQPNDALWEQMFQALIEFKQQYGHTQVPTSHPGKLGKWVLNQRARRRLLEKLGEGKAKGMTWARVEKLDAIDFVWEASGRRAK